MPLNPKIAQVLDMIARAKRPPMHEMTPQQARASYAKSAQILDLDALPIAKIEDYLIPARDGTALRARCYQPFEASWFAPAPALLYFHGGGFTVGSIETHDALCRMLAVRSECFVVSLDYRLAPEYRFPTAVHDAHDALLWLHEQATALGIDPGRIAVGGDSAGGTLATVCAVLARDAGIQLALQLLIYPGTSAHQQTASHARYAEGYLLSATTIQWFFDLYVRDPADREDWRFAPLDGTSGAKGASGMSGPPDMRGLAPAWIAAPEYDPLFDECVAYAAKLREAGNSVELVEYAGMIHEFFKMARYVPEVADAHRDAIRALRRAFGHAAIG